MTEEYKEMTRFMERYKDLAFAHLARAEKAEAIQGALTLKQLLDGETA